MKYSMSKLRAIVKEELFYREFHRKTEELTEASEEETVRQDTLAVHKQKRAEKAAKQHAADRDAKAQKFATRSAKFDAEQKEIKNSGKWWLAGLSRSIYIPNSIDRDRIKDWLVFYAGDYIPSTDLNDIFYVYEPDPVDLINPVFRWIPGEEKMLDVPSLKD